MLLGDGDNQERAWELLARTLYHPCLHDLIEVHRNNQWCKDRYHSLEANLVQHDVNVSIQFVGLQGF